MINVAVLGYGYWGSKHARVLASLPGVRLTIVDTDSTRLTQARAAFPTARLGESLSDAVSTVDAVVVATPPQTHARLALMAVQAGRHALVEKPLATGVEDCQELIDAADRAGVALMVGHTFEYNAAVWKLRELIHARELGDICYIDTARLNLGVYQQDVNVIWDLAPHDISIINLLLGRLPDAVSAWGHHSATESLEDVAYLQLRYTDPDLRAYIHVSWLDPCKVRRVTVVGRDKMAVYDDVSVNERIRVHDVGVTPFDPGDAPDGSGDSLHHLPMSYRYGAIVSPYIPFDEPLAVQDAHFAECIRDGTRPQTDGASGLAVVRVLESATRALRIGGEVPLDGTPTRVGRVRAGKAPVRSKRKRERQPLQAGAEA